MSGSPLIAVLAAGLTLGAAGAAVAARAPPVADTPAPIDTIPPPAPAGTTAPAAATPLSGLTVAVPATPPVVVSTFPAAGAAVAGGTLVLKVTFDQNMDGATWGYAKGDAGDYPECLAKPRLLSDERTFVLLCRTLRGKSYSVRLNSGDGGFTSVGRRTATPFELQFTTSMADPVLTLKDAMTQAGLHDDDGPIEGIEVAPR